MNKFYRFFFWFCFSILIAFLSLIIYIASVYNIYDLEYLKAKFDKFANSQIQKKVQPSGNMLTEKDIKIVNEIIMFRKAELGQARINEEVRKTFFAQPGKPIKKTLIIEPNTVLEVGYGIVPDLSNEKYLGNVKFSIILEYKNKNIELFAHEVENRKLRCVNKRTLELFINSHEVKIDGEWLKVKWYDTSIDLSPYAGDKVTINFITENQESTSPWAVWSHSKIYQKDKINKDYNVLIVSLDTLGADHLNCYGYKKRITSPNLDKLSEEGLLFKNFYSNAPQTLSSQMSILTGLYPNYHGITTRNWKAGNNLASLALIPKETLTTTLANHGYYCVAYTGGGYFSSVLNYSRGFHLYNNTHDYTYGSVKNVFPKAFKWLEKNKNRKFFMFLHTYEIHDPYTENYFVKKEKMPSLPKFERDRVKYDSGILLTDQYIGKLVSVLKENDLWEKTILIITSDHGDDLGKRFAVPRHGHSLFNELIHVPCIIILPNEFEQGKVIDSIASSVDLVPTILDMLKIKNPIKYSGKSLLPVIYGNEDKDRFAYSEDVYPVQVDLKSLVMKNNEGTQYKFLYVNPLGKKLDILKNPKFSAREEFSNFPPKRLFNLEKDPSEMSDLLNILPVDYTPYQNIINNIIKNQPAIPKPKKVLKSTQSSLNALKALGYIQ